MFHLNLLLLSKALLLESLLLPELSALLVHLSPHWFLEEHVNFIELIVDIGILSVFFFIHFNFSDEELVFIAEAAT